MPHHHSRDSIRIGAQTVNKTGVSIRSARCVV